jgi:endonuclease/exonuclease/phosphatase family metal-dependent hydrolase
MGDFNAPPESDIVRFLTGMTSLGGDRAHFVDVASWHGPPSSPSATYDATRNAFAAAGNLPTRRIDYLLLRKRDRTALGVPLRVQLAFTEPAGGVWASDHFGVWADLSAQE